MNKTGIEYLDYTWNPIAMRCTPVSEACENCWHLRACDRLKNNPGLPMAVREAHAGDREPFLVESRLDDPLKVKNPSIIGVQFMGDLWHRDIEWPIIDKIFEVTLKAQWHKYIFLSKRIESAWYYFRSPIYPESPLRRSSYLTPKNWLGVTVENQARADERIPTLLQIPAAVRWVSYEPALGLVDFLPYLHDNSTFQDIADPKIHWLVCGSETGPGARPMRLVCAEQALSQCRAGGIPFYMKSVVSSGKGILPDDLMVREFPKTD